MSSPQHKKILVFGYLPPPYFGPSVTYQALLRSKFPERFDVTFVDITVSERISDIERLRPGKLLKMFGFLLRELWLLVTHRFDFCFYPLSFNRNAFIKDTLLLGVARVFGVPTVLYAHGNHLPAFHAGCSPRLQRQIERTCRQATAAIVLGESLRFNFEPWLPAERIFSVPTGIEPAEPLIPIRHDRVTVLYLGNLIREKGVFVLLEAARRCPNVQFIFAGHWIRPEDETEAKQAAGNNVRFIGPVTGLDKARALANADILAFPTFYHYETMGLVLLEAMQAGVPIVTTRRASIPEMVHDGEQGLMVNEQDPADLEEKILRLAGDPSLRARLGEAGRQRFASFYTHHHYGERMIAVFDSLTRARQVTDASPSTLNAAPIKTDRG